MSTTQRMYLTEAEAKAKGLPSPQEQIDNHNRAIYLTEERLTAWRHADGSYLNSGDAKMLIDEVFHLRKILAARS